jgi:hypothetical protein
VETLMYSSGRASGCDSPGLLNSEERGVRISSLQCPDVLCLESMTRFLCMVTLALLLAGCSDNTKPASQPAKEPEPPGPARILQFYAYPGAVDRGEHTSLCYGVENVRSVRIEPVSEPIPLSGNKCIQISPRSTTAYTLIAEGQDGRTVSQKLTVEVKGVAAARPAPQRVAHEIIRFFIPSANEIAPGQMVTLCYSLENATSVRVEPNVRSLQPDPKACFAVTPEKTTTYTLIATGKSGETDRETVTITMR